MMMSHDSAARLKIVLIGPSGVGKSALLTAYCHGRFDPESSIATIACDFKTKLLSVRNTPYRLQLLDTAGQERFRTLSNSYYRGAHGVLLIYDVCNRESFLSMDHWFEEAQANTMPGVITYLVGTKLDKAPTSRAVSTYEGHALAQQHHCHGFCEVSAKTHENVRRPFVELVDRIVNTPALLASIDEMTRARAGGGVAAAGVGAGVGGAFMLRGRSAADVGATAGAGAGAGAGNAGGGCSC